MRFTILLPSAEGKASGGNPLAPDMFDYRSSNTFNYFSDLNPERRALIKALQKQVRNADEAELEKLFGVKGATLEEAVEVTGDVFKSPLMASVDRYGPGVLYTAMDFAGLPTGSQRRLLENGVIFSGLFGLLRPDDLIPNYRLKMDAKVGDLGRVGSYWKEPLSAALNKLVTGHAVWNLLPGVHESAWDDEETYARMIRVKFYKQDESGERTAVSHGVKELRGSLVAFIVNETADSVDALDEWEAPDGYEVDLEGSDLDENGSGTVVMVSSPGWEKRRASRRKAKAQAEAEAAAARAAREAEDD
ncbi:YaaA family protein [Rubrivirga sp.]|uniref:YaaA family protein n=1 Tax=Rubrivirga sp. TaxID=1885344 RepID=UPI003C781CC6